MGKGASLTETEGDWLSIASGPKASRPLVKVPWKAGSKVTSCPVLQTRLLQLVVGPCLKEMGLFQITEDAYLTMQQDWLLLKQQEKEKDDKLRRCNSLPCPTSQQRCKIHMHHYLGKLSCRDCNYRA